MASKEHIRGVHKTPALENDGPKLVMLNDSGKFSPRNDQGLREMLHIFVSKNNLKFTMLLNALKTIFRLVVPKVCQLYDLGESDDPSLSVFPPFAC
ncbi:hypothetical protein RhiirA1_189266 [Rhizophagus irregularis]|uniref:Uncharacterized protein n=1 Tax=Rhizophagus irregularis TaxID=588596 RepID=A0A2N0SG54_9GLOM|nr:hypothetical protein RhiirA1_189266 [Rhizophagus irregularis]